MSTQDAVGELLARLRAPVPDLATLLSLLAAPLHSLGVLNPAFQRYNLNPLPPASLQIQRHVPSLQQTILTHIGPTWLPTLQEQHLESFVFQYFCPDAFSFSKPAAGELALFAYSSILSDPLTDLSINILARLTSQYPLDSLHSIIFDSQTLSVKCSTVWEDFVRNLCMVPGKVANVLADKAAPPHILNYSEYFSHVASRTEVLVSTLANKGYTETDLQSLVYLVHKLVNIGMFPSSSASSPSFFKTLFPKARSNIGFARYFELWATVFRSLPSPSSLLTALTSAFALIPSLDDTDDSFRTRHAIKKEAILLYSIFGPLNRSNRELWDMILALLGKREWSAPIGRILVCWVVLGSASAPQALEDFLKAIQGLWTSGEHIKRSLLSRHRLLTLTLLVALSNLPDSSKGTAILATSPKFIQAVGAYLSHLDSSIRQCGMLCAEVVAHKAGRDLNFGIWGGSDPSLVWAKEVRQLLHNRDIDVTLEEMQSEIVKDPSLEIAGSEPTHVILESGEDSDDSLSGYSSDGSSPPDSPTPSELEQIEKEPSLAAGITRIQRPVYLAQLGQMLRGTTGLQEKDPNKEADTLQAALHSAEDLIRRKEFYGMELEENAINLSFLLVGLQDNYELDGFEEKRQAALTALVACCPTKAAPTLIQEFFSNQYSVVQRFNILNALVCGVRELAGLQPRGEQSKALPFPSRLLPPGKHQQLESRDAFTQLLADINQKAIAHGAHIPIPEDVRHKKLRVRSTTKISEVKEGVLSSRLSPTLRSQRRPFSALAAEYFIMPLINRFWLFLRDEQTREERTNNLSGRAQYRGAGTGLVLNPLVLSRFLGALAILMHASINAPEWLAVIAPDALELALTIGSKPVSLLFTDDDRDADEQEAHEASVLTASLELALVAVRGSLELDGGRSLSLEKTELLLGSKEWAASILQRLTEGAKLPGGGGEQYGRLRQATAELLLKIEEIGNRWRRSMVDL